jgi:alpha-tubulin suppressor-like RCC1 family protein
MLVYATTSLTIATLNPGHSAAATTPPTGALRNVKQIATGSSFACALLIEGTVDCWGSNYNGELGNGSFGNGSFGYANPNPEPVPTLSKVRQIAAGDFESCALLANRTVDCWGMIYPVANNPADDSVDTPEPVTGLSGVTQLGAGGGGACALMMNQTVNCWGDNEFGQLGDGSTTYSSTPVQVVGLNHVVQLAVGEFNSCALLENRTVDCWGDGVNGQLGNGSSGLKQPLSTRFVKVRGLRDATWVATGNGTSCAAIKGGTVKCWGNNISDQLLTSLSTTSIPVKTQGLSGVSKVTLGQTNGCALLVKGTVECWGDNELQGTWVGGPSQGLPYYPYPYQVAGLANVTQLSTGIGDGVSQFSCALLRNTSVKCWGLNFDGELGSGTTGDVMTPTIVSGLPSALQISAGADHTCALLESGSIDCWGLDMYGELGDGARADSPKPITVPGVSDATEVSAGEFDTCALLRGGTVKCWGLNNQGELGDGRTSASSTSAGPVLVKNLSDVKQISVGWTNSCALLASGSVMCWGNNSEGQLGTGNVKQSSSPVRVLGLTNATQVAVGNEDSCALLTNGSVECWGSGSSGQLGNGTFSANSLLPVVVQGITTATEISLGDSSACALLSSGSLNCWGNDFEDQLGNFEAAAGGESNSSPVVVAQISNATSVASGGQTSCALISPPSLACWGSSNYFQYPSSNGIVGNWAPTTIGDVTGVSQVTIGEYHVCALFNSASVECWGDNFDGQDGNGHLGFSTNPVWVHL